MTPLQLAKAECANCDGSGNCQGIGIKDDLSLYQFRQSGRCYLAPDKKGKIQACRCFEECVLPMLPKLEPHIQGRSPQQIAGMREAGHAYEMAVMPIPTARYAKCRGCQQNVTAPKRLCSRCAKRRKLQSNNRSRMRKNGAIGALIIKDL
jgi:hypothetical protein